ncbi:MAG TPA: hypothetical protein VLT47_07185 [Anaeromyxobacteraceae bacterium]|nr:hypothetical protein [Anaeromyxobacteraceae bacterium]
MAVKVMVAPAIVKGEVSRSPVSTSAPQQKEAPKPRRRKSAVYDAEGNEVFITLMCLKCHKMKPLSQFGLRKMADGAIRNQPWCRPCRSGAGAEKPRGARKDPAVSEGSIETAAPAVLAEGIGEAVPRPAPAAPADPNLAAQIAAALYRGRG